MSYGGIIGQQPALEASGISYNNNQTSSIITGDNVQTAIDQLFTSVSNGKNKIASAITGKGVSTSPSDSFDVMAGNIGKIVTGFPFDSFKTFQNAVIGDSRAVLNSAKFDSFVVEGGSTSGWELYQRNGPSFNMSDLTIETTIGFQRPGIYTYAWSRVKYNRNGNIISTTYDSQEDYEQAEISGIRVSSSGDYRHTVINLQYTLDGRETPKATISYNLLGIEARFKAVTDYLNWPVEY